MPKFLTCAIMLGALAAYPAAAKPQTRTEKVAEAKASIEEMADETAITFYQKRAASRENPHIPMETHRRYGRWLAAGFSIGMCEKHAKATLVADWLSKLDGLASSFGDETGGTRMALQSAGNGLRKSGQQHSMTDDETPANGARLTSCRKSGIFSVIITQNEPNHLEFYSANQNGRGKAIGGFRIAPANEPAALEAAKDIQQRAEELGAEFQDTKRALAAMLFESIKPGLNEKQKQVLGTLPEDQIITAMASQLDGTATSPFTFDIPIDFTDEDGNHYANIKLTVASDTAA